VAANRGRQLWLASVAVVACLLLALVEVGIYLAYGPPRVNRSLATVELWPFSTRSQAADFSTGRTPRLLPVTSGVRQAASPDRFSDRSPPDQHPISTGSAAG
jgi:hypothetical protein